MLSAVRQTIGALARPRGEARVEGRSKTTPCPSPQCTTMSHADTQSRGRTSRQNWCAEEGEPLRMGSTNLHNSKERWIGKIHLRLLRTEQKDIEEATSCSKHSGHAFEPRRVSMGNEVWI